MKPQELRIGNLFQEKHSGKIIEVVELTQKNVTFSGKFPKLWQAVKIPLTEEWLLKFGFVKTNVPMKFDTNYIDYRKGQFVLFVLPKGIIEVEFCAAHNNIEERGYLCAIKHVHQLQNLYFALTGKELEVNP